MTSAAAPLDELYITNNNIKYRWDRVTYQTYDAWGIFA